MRDVADIFDVTADSFGSATARSFKVLWDDTIEAVSPLALPGTVDVRVTTPLGTSEPSSGSRFTYGLL